MPLCGLSDSTLRQGDVPTAARIGDAVSRLAARRPDDESIQLADGLMASQLVWQRDLGDDQAKFISTVQELAKEADPPARSCLPNVYF